MKGWTFDQIDDLAVDDFWAVWDRLARQAEEREEARRRSERSTMQRH